MQGEKNIASLQKANGPLMRPVWLFLLLVLLDLDHFAALVETTVRADDVLQDHGTAVPAGDQAGGLQCVVGATAVTAAFREFSLWLRGHFVLLILSARSVADAPKKQNL
jgi:hypothetical protein